MSKEPTDEARREARREKLYAGMVALRAEITALRDEMAALREEVEQRVTEREVAR